MPQIFVFRRLGLLTAAAAILLWPGAAAAGDRVVITARPVALDPADSSVTSVGRLRYRGGLVIESRDRRFAEFSALHVSADGSRLLAVSDRGFWLKARVILDSRGWLADLDQGEMGALVGRDGRPLSGRARDAESLALLPGGGWVIAFERDHRLWRYGPPPFASPPRPLAPPPGLHRAPANGGIEALTRLADGRLLAIAERLKAGPGTAAAWVRTGDGWRPLGYGLVGDFVPTGAATLPSGDVMVVERSYRPLRGVRVRLRLVAARAIRPGARIEGTEMARLAPPLTVDNFEGISARAGAEGETLVYLLSDDNGNPLQRTLLLMFAL